MTTPTIYYKDSELDKFRTVCSLVSYYFREWAAGRIPARVVTMTSVEDEFSTPLGL